MLLGLNLRNQFGGDIVAPSAEARLMATLDKAAPDALDVSIVTSEEASERKILDRDRAGDHGRRRAHVEAVASQRNYRDPGDVERLLGIVGGKAGLRRRR